MKRIINLFLLISSVFLPFLASASEETITLDDVVVTATRYEEPVITVPANIIIISEEDIKNSSAQNIPDLLRTKAGLHVNDITGNRRNFTVDMRGFGESSSSNTLVLVDGRRVNQADLSAVDWVQIPLERISRIEIIKSGRGSVLYGDNATGGVINIFTKESDVFKGGAEISGGSYDTFQSNAYISGSFKDLSLYLSGRYLTSDGYRENSDTEAKDIGLNISYSVHDAFNLNIKSGYHKDNTGLPGSIKESDFASGMSRTDTKYPNDFMDVEDYYLSISPEVYLTDIDMLRFDASARKRSFFSFASGDFGNFSGDSEIDTIILSPHILLKNEYEQIKNTLILGADYTNIENDIINQSLFFGTETIEHFNLKKENFGYYLHDEIAIAERVYLSGGYRHDRTEFSFDPSTPEKVDMQKDLYTVGITVMVSQKSYVYSSFSRSFRYPLLDEQYSFFTNSVNTDLASQSSDNFEIGARQYFSDSAYIHLNFFNTNTDDEIFFNANTYMNENLDGTAKRQGIEMAFSVEPFQWMKVKGGYTYLHTKIKGGAFDGSKIPNAPEHQASFEVTSDLGKGFILSLNGIYIGKRPFISDFSNSYDNQKSYTVFNSKLEYQWKSLRAFLNINNLTDKEYSEYGVLGGFPVEKAYYPSPERNFLAGVSIEF